MSDGDFETLETFCVNEVYISKKYWYTATIKVRVHPIVFKIDTGAAFNVIWIPQFRKLGLNCTNLSQSKVVLRSFSKNKIPVIGKCLISCFYKGCKVDNNIEFMIVDQECSNIISIETSEELGLISRVDSLSLSQQEFISN